MAHVVATQVPEWIKEPFEWWNCGDFEPMLDHYAEDAEYDFSAVFTDSSPHRGRESLRRQWNEMLETWEGIRMDPIEAFRIDDETFVLSMRLWGKGKLSGAEIDQRFAGLYTVRPSDNRVVRMKLFPTAEAAVEFAAAAT
ncbi:MAG TPA: nuclear transport factor 2 family protein [Thermoleophilaceae bacterium]|nr:nuclear transport factor 2 family protein [Thermoleophilaceae bacterium]